MAKTMLDDHRTPRRFFIKSINIVCHVSNHIFLRDFLNKTSYELRIGQPPKVSHFRVFGCRCFVLKQGNLDKFESQSSDGIFLGYPLHSRTYRVLNLEANCIMDTCEVTFDETLPCSSPIFEAASLDQMRHTIFVEGEHDDANWGDLEPTPSLLRLMDPIPLLPPLEVQSSQCLLTLEDLRLLLMGRPPIRG